MDSLPVLGTMGLGLSAWSLVTSPFAPLLGPRRWPRLGSLLAGAGVAGMVSSVTLALRLRDDVGAALITSATPFAALLVSFAVVRTLSASWSRPWITTWLHDARRASLRRPGAWLSVWVATALLQWLAGFGVTSQGHRLLALW